MKNSNLTPGLWQGLFLFVLYLGVYYCPDAYLLIQAFFWTFFLITLCNVCHERMEENALTWLRWVGIVIIGAVVLAAVGKEWLVYLGFSPEKIEMINGKWTFYPLLAFVLYVWVSTLWQALKIVKFIFKPKNGDEYDKSIQSWISCFVLVVLIISFQHIV